MFVIWQYCRFLTQWLYLYMHFYILYWFILSLFFRVNGGVSKNDFVMQSLADSTGLEVERPVSVEMSILGVAFLAGLQCGTKKFYLLLL